MPARPPSVERLFEAIANYTYDWESWMGSDGRPRWINPAVERISGYTVAECLAMPDYPLPLVHEEDRPAIARHLAAAAAGASGNDVAFRILHRSGAVVWAAVSWQTLRDETGRSLGYRTSVRDISQRKQAEEALRRAHAETERASRAKSRFLAAASHDLRQPLQAVNLLVAALKPTMTDAESAEIISAIEDSLRATNDLLDALLDVSRLDAGALKARPRPIYVSDLLDRMTAEFAGAARDKGIQLRVVASSAAIRSDPPLLDRILRNLVANAIRYTERGRVLVGCRRRGDQVRIEVWDTGIGIPGDKLDAVFEEFYQLGNPERDRTRGLGLGLAVVDRVAKLLGHPIEVRSEVAKGSVFAVTVPSADAADAAGPGPPAPPERLAGAFVLAIDDDAVQLDAMARLFRRWGCDVLTATSAADALARLAGRSAPDVVIADYRLRDEANGAEAIEAVRDLFGRAVPGLILTGDTEPSRLAGAKASGFPLLHKPIDSDRLRDALQAVLAR